MVAKCLAQAFTRGANPRNMHRLKSHSHHIRKSFPEGIKV